MWREMPVFRAFLYITFRVHNKESILQVSLTELPKREMFRFQALLQVSESPPHLPWFSKEPLWREMPVSRAHLNT
jgi:hypothetical protein